MRALLIILSLTVAVAVAFASENQTFVLDQDQPSNIITNGYSAYGDKAPYMVALTAPNFRVGGVLIAHNWVLTAAHCLNRDSVVIHYGSNTQHGRITHHVSKENFIRHPNWPRWGGSDIGLIRTPYVKFTDRINKVKLPSFNQRNEQFINWDAVACGWGRQSNGHHPERLQCIDVKIITNQECGRHHGGLAAGNLCTRGTDRKSICAGDSGGPLVTLYKPTLVGITSFMFGGAGGCNAGAPSGFTRVTTHLDWIKRISGVSYE